MCANKHPKNDGCIFNGSRDIQQTSTLGLTDPARVPVLQTEREFRRVNSENCHWYTMVLLVVKKSNEPSSHPHIVLLQSFPHQFHPSLPHISPTPVFPTSVPPQSSPHQSHPSLPHISPTPVFPTSSYSSLLHISSTPVFPTSVPPQSTPHQFHPSLPHMCQHINSRDPFSEPLRQ